MSAARETGPGWWLGNAMVRWRLRCGHFSGDYDVAEYLCGFCGTLSVRPAPRFTAEDEERMAARLYRHYMTGVERTTGPTPETAESWRDVRGSKRDGFLSAAKMVLRLTSQDDGGVFDARG